MSYSVRYFSLGNTLYHHRLRAVINELQSHLFMNALHSIPSTYWAPYLNELHFHIFLAGEGSISSTIGAEILMSNSDTYFWPAQYSFSSPTGRIHIWITVASNSGRLNNQSHHQMGAYLYELQWHLLMNALYSIPLPTGRRICMSYIFTYFWPAKAQSHQLLVHRF